MMMKWFFLILHFYKFLPVFTILPLDIFRPSNAPQPYPEGFLFGSSTSAYQSEGAWNVDGKGPSIWDTFVHQVPSPIIDGSTGDVACNSYYLYKEDIKNLVKLGVKIYRFSISWPRIFPDGTIGSLNQLGVQHYSNLIDEVLKHGIIPMVSMYHWDLPQALQNYGGWVNNSIVNLYGDYADFLFKTYGDRVKWWLTLNEPINFCVAGYGTGAWAPGVVGYGRLEYQCIYNSILAHARAYHIYQDNYKSQGGKISLSLNTDACYPKQQTQDDVDACNKYYEFFLGMYAHPIYTVAGNFPETVIQTVDTNSRNEGLNTSRLVHFNQTQIDYIKGTADFFAINIYGSTLGAAESTTAMPSFSNDLSVATSDSRFWPQTQASFIQITPKAMRDILVLIKERYGNPEIIVTENGMADAPLFDKNRLLFYKTYWGSMQRAILEDKVRVVGYIAWTLMDDFEWTNGYTTLFGLYYTNFSDPKRTRTPRASASFYKLYVSSNTQT